jgi:hypothetical protein
MASIMLSNDEPDTGSSSIFANISVVILVKLHTDRRKRI